MKNLLFLLTMLAATNAFGQRIDNKIEYIEFKNLGADDNKYISPIFISQSKLDIELDESELEHLKNIQSLPVKMTKEDFINLHYDLLVTDEQTYSTLLSFIVGHNEFYLNGLDRFNPSGSLVILTGGKTFYLYYKTQSSFFNQLLAVLKEKNCDKKIIDKLGHIH